MKHDVIKGNFKKQKGRLYETDVAEKTLSGIYIP